MPRSRAILGGHILDGLRLTSVVLRLLTEKSVGRPCGTLGYDNARPPNRYPSAAVRTNCRWPAPHKCRRALGSTPQLQLAPVLNRRNYARRYCAPRQNANGHESQLRQLARKSSLLQQSIERTPEVLSR